MRAHTWCLIAVAALSFGTAGCVHPSATTKWPETKPANVGSAPPSKELELPPSDQASLCLKMAETLEKEGKEADAITYYEQARQLSPALNERAARRLAVLYDRVDQQAKAMIEFQGLLKKYPKDSTLLNDVGYSYFNRGQWAEAEVYLRKSLAADKANKRAWINLGLALAQQGKYAEGYDAFIKAVTPAEAHANLAFVLATQEERRPGSRAEAIQEYRQALALEPTLPVARQALARLEAPSQTLPESPTALPVAPVLPN